MYNVEKYIGRCLQSVVGQSFYDIEIICVDDCSPDNSLQIVEQYAKQDKRIKIIKNPQNLKLGKTREAGFFASNGEYVTFVDADDTISFDYIQKLYKKAKEVDAEVVKANVKMWVNGGGNEYFIKPESKNIDMLLEKKQSLILSNWFDLWGFLIKRDLILDNNIMPDTINGDDSAIVRIFYYAKNVAIENKAFYHYIYAQEGSWSGEMNEASFLVRLNYMASQIVLINSFDKVDKQTYIAFVKNHLNNAYGCVQVICQTTNTEWQNLIASEFIRAINDEIKLTSDEKEKYIFAFMDKGIAKAITEKDSKALVKLAQRKSTKAYKLIRLMAKIISSVLIFKEPRRKLRNKITNLFCNNYELYIAKNL